VPDASRKFDATQFEISDFKRVFEEDFRESARYSATLNFSPQIPALTNCRRISNLSGGCMIFRPPLADLIPDNFAAYFASPEMNFQKVRKTNFKKKPKLIPRRISRRQG